MTAVSQADFAVLIGKDKSYVTRLKQKQRLVLTPEGLVDVEKSKELIAMTADPGRTAGAAARAAGQSDGGQGQDVHNVSYNDSKALNERYKALTSKAEYEVLIGKLVDAEEARLFAADLSATFRGTLEVLPDRLAPELVALKDTEAVRALLVESFEQVLMDLSDKIAKWGKVE